MINLTMNRHSDFQYDKVLKSEGNKRDVLRFQVYYLKTFSGKKGIFVSITPKTIEQGEGYTTESVMLYAKENVSVFAVQLARKSDKAVLQLAEKLDAKVPAIIALYEQYGPESGREAIRAAVAETAGA